MKNVVLNFAKSSVFENQPLAVMPAELAKKLLYDYSTRLQKSSVERIVDDHIVDLRNAETMDSVLKVSMSFIQERELIQNCANQNWGAYEPESVMI